MLWGIVAVACGITLAQQDDAMAGWTLGLLIAASGATHVFLSPELR